MVRATSVLTWLLQGEEAGGDQVRRGRTTGMEVREGLAPQSGTVTSVPVAPGAFALILPATPSWENLREHCRPPPGSGSQQPSSDRRGAEGHTKGMPCPDHPAIRCAL